MGGYRDPRALDYGEYHLAGKTCGNLDEVEALLVGKLPTKAVRKAPKKARARR